VKGYFFVGLSSLLIFVLTRSFYLGLTRHEEQREVLLTNPNIGLITFIPGGKILAASHNVAAFLGYEPGELTGKSIYDLTHAPDLQLEQAQINQVLAGESDSFQIEKRLLHKSGEPIWVGITGSVKRKTGEPAYYVASVQNLRALEETKQQLATQLNEKEALFNSTTDMMWAIDTQMRLRTFNEAYRKTMERITGEPLSMGDSVLNDSMDPEVRAHWERLFQRALQGERFTALEEILLGEQLVPSEISFYPIWLQGKVTGVSMFAKDISRTIAAQKEKDAALHELAARSHFIETTLDHLPIGIAVSRIDEGFATYQNQAFSQIYGWAPGELTDVATFFEKVYPDPLYREQIKERILADMQSGDPARMQWKNIKVTTQNGQERTILAKNIPVYEQGLMISTVIDETEKRRSQALFEQIFEHIPVMITIYDPPVSSIRVNRAFEAITGYTNALIPEIDLMARAYPDPEQRIAAIEWMNQTNQGWKEMELTTAEGRKRRQEWTNLRLADDTTIGIGIDVTELRRQEHELLKANKQLLTAQRIAKLGYWERNPNEEDLFWTEEVYRIWEENPRSFRPTLSKLLASIHPEDREAFALRREEGEGGKESFVTEHRIICRSGKIKWVKEIGQTLKNSEGKVVLFTGSVQDISDQKATQLKLQEQQAYLKILTDNAYDVILACNETGELVYQNQTLKEWLGEKDLIGLNRSKWPLKGYLYSPGGGRLMLEEELPLFRAFHGENLRMVQYSLKLTGQPTRMVEASGGAFHDDAGKRLGAVVVIRDITERHNREQQITHAILQATEQERAYIARELHDGLTQNLSIASMNLKNLVYDYEGIGQAARYLKARRYLDFSIEQSRTVAHQLIPKAISDFGLVPAIEELLEDLQETYSAALDFSYNDRADLPPEVTLNLYRIVQEALHNIQKHAQAQQVAIRLEMASDQLRLTIEDDGIGFSPSSEAGLPLGIGLRTMHSRASQVGGSLRVDSQLGEGTRIDLFVPLPLNMPAYV